ncbi:MAG: putative nucleic acid-binding Zn ribbon protein [Verrucomicrobiales bacterium]|jgi:predicted nucleic acid-binding Zn ribbon protein
MATYIYETIPSSAEEPMERFEIKQGMMENPLQTHPDTGKPIRRVITGGLGYVGSGSSNPGPSSSSDGGGC